jgi:glycolate oxidase
MLEPEVLLEIEAIVGRENVLTAPEDVLLYQYDASLDLALPEAVVLPGTGREVAELVKVANRRRIPFTARGSGTNLSGGWSSAWRGSTTSWK